MPCIFWFSIANKNNSGRSFNAIQGTYCFPLPTGVDKNIFTGFVIFINADFIRSVNFYSGSFPADKYNALSRMLDFRLKDGITDLGEHDINIIVSDCTTDEWTINEDAYILYTKDGSTDYESHSDMSGAISLSVKITEYVKGRKIYRRSFFWRIS